MTTISEPDTMALAVTGVTKHYDSPASCWTT